MNRYKLGIIWSHIQKKSTKLIMGVKTILKGLFSNVPKQTLVQRDFCPRCKCDKLNSVQTHFFHTRKKTKQ